MAELIVSLPILHQAQQEMADQAARYNVAAMGRRFGKTKFGIHRLMMGPKNLLEPAGYPAGWFAPSSRYVDDVWDELVARFDQIIEYKNRQSGRMRFITGSTLDFWSMGEDREVARGRRYARVIVDEAAHIRYLEDAWTKAVEPTLTDFQGEAWFISTPNGVNYFHALFQRGMSGDPLWRSWRLPSTANPHLHPEEIAAKRELVPELVFRQEYLAEFVTFGAGLVKPEHLADGIAPAGLPVVLGVDLAISEKASADYTAIAAMSRDPVSGMVYLREIERHRIGFHEVLNRIQAAAERWRPAMIAIEQTQYQAAVVQELARTTTLPVRGVKPDRDKITRFAPLLTRYEQRMVRHDPARVPAWFRDELLAFPEGEHDDGVDACAHAFSAMITPVTQPPMDIGLTTSTAA